MTVTVQILDWEKDPDYTPDSKYRAYIGGGLWLEINKGWECRPRRDNKGGFWSAKRYFPDVFDIEWDIRLVDSTGDWEYISLGVRTLHEAQMLAYGWWIS